MNTNFKLSSIIPFFIIFLFSSLLLTACGDKEELDEYGSVIIKDHSYLEAGKDVSDPVLSAGQILLVRLVYDIEENDSSDTEWYKVELSRIGANWSDSVKIQGIIRSEFRHYDDYVFSSDNFNWQVEQEAYGIDSLDGYYELTIRGSNGYYNLHNLHWANGKWTNASPTLTFSVW